jgi:hypothetical protein
VFQRNVVRSINHHKKKYNLKGNYGEHRRISLEKE